MNSNIVTWKRGAVGKVIEFNDLRDFTGLVTLTAYTVTFTVESLAGTVLINAAAVTKRDQSSRPGDCYITLDATTANIAAGKHRGEVKLTNGSNVDYWPTDRDGNRTYIDVIVQAPLG